MGGSDDPSNLIELSIEEHAEAHRKLYEQYGLWQDKMAWLSLSGQVETADIARLIRIESNKNRIISDSTREKHRQNALKQTNRVNPPVGINRGSFRKGHIPANKGSIGFMSEAGKEKIRESNRRRALNK